MNFYIQNIKLNGCKNIDKEINMNFCNSTLTKKMNLQNSSIKAIYGPNGAGKSGIMSALYIYKRLLCEKNSLNDNYFRNFVSECINKKMNEMYIEITFIFFNKDEVVCTIKHEIIIGKEENEVKIVREKLYDLKGMRIKEEKFMNIISIVNGKIDYIVDDKDDYIKNATYNLLDYNSVVIATSNVLVHELREKSGFTFVDLFITKLFAYELTIELNKEDKHLEYISNKQFLENINDKDINIEEIKKQINDKIELSSVYDDTIIINKIKEYEKMINDLTSFIKIFKPSLKGIDIDKKTNNKFYKCKKIFVYDDYSIDMEFESTGIKKLVRLYSHFRKYVNGGVVFIDEMDANLHDVYFTKLIEFFKFDAKGQLCFTTHNLEPIDVLKNNKFALEFLSNDSRIASWVKGGHKSPMNKYVNGLIPYSTFNVDSTDFDVLLEDSNE